MGNLHLVTGYAGEEHITSNDQGSFNAALMGIGEFVLERGKQFEIQVISNNKVRIFDGDLLMQGRHIRLKEDTYVDLFFENGTQGYKRTDLIAVRYEKDPITNIESASLVVIKGVPTEDAYVSPEKITGDIISEHALQNDTLLYKVNFDGLGIQEPEKVFSTIPTLETMKKETIKQIEDDAQKAIQDMSYAVDELVPLLGTDSPTPETQGRLKQFFVNTENGEIFVCTGEGETYTWKKAGGGNDSNIESMGNELQLKINGVMQQLFAQAVYIGQCAWSLGEVLKWGMEDEFFSSNKGSIGNMAIYRPWTNTWEEKYNSYNYNGSIKSNDWLTGNLEVATLRPKSILDTSYKDQSLREDRVVFTPFDWLKQWFPVGIESNLLFSSYKNVLTVAFTYKEYYKESGTVKSPWGKAFVNMYDAQNLDKTPSGNALEAMGMYINFGRDIKSYWNNLDTAKFEYKDWFLFFRVIMIDWAKLFSQEFLDDPKNGYVEKYGNKIGVIYGNNLNWDNIPVNNQIKGL